MWETSVSRSFCNCSKGRERVDLEISCRFGGVGGSALACTSRSALVSSSTLPARTITLPYEHLSPRTGQKELRDKCPPAVLELLESKGAVEPYERFVQAVYETKETRQTVTGKWKDAEFASVLDQFRDDFASRGLRVALCARRSSSGTRRWLEYIDVERVGAFYVPQYDVADVSGQVIKTIYSRLKFPTGVAVEELKVRC